MMPSNKSSQTLAVVFASITIVSLLFVPGAWAQTKYKTLHAFEKGAGGYAPNAGVIFDQAGNMYGTASEGGSTACQFIGCGTVFELTPHSDGRWTKTTIYEFAGGNDGREPVGGLVFDQLGNLYGTTAAGGSGCPNGCGTVFELTPDSHGGWTEQVIYNFAGTPDGGGPLAGLIFDQSGNLYGTTFRGGANCQEFQGCGTVFQLTPQSGGGWSETVLYSFCSQASCQDGSYPSYGGLIFDQAGKIYGTTEFGGAGSRCGKFCGVVFRLTPQSGGGWTEDVVHNFLGGKDGAFPGDALIFDQAGSLYGTTGAGGIGFGCSFSQGCGVVFKLTPGQEWQESILHRFRGIEGTAPLAGVTFDNHGNLYGTTFEGGSRGAGVVFELQPNSKGGWDYRRLHVFEDHPGATPYAGVVFDSAGNLYGTTWGDQTGTFGSVFEIAP